MTEQEVSHREFDAYQMGRRDERSAAGGGDGDGDGTHGQPVDIISRIEGAAAEVMAKTANMKAYCDALGQDEHDFDVCAMFFEVARQSMARVVDRMQERRREGGK